MDSSFFEDLGARGLAGEVAWLRELAASLVRDPEEAEDLAGEVWVQALRRRPVVSEERPLRAWLTVVVRRLASRKRREGISRREREERAARPDRIPGADDPIRRVELQRKLVEAVLALPEPYRSAVVLRHLEQLAIPDIARRQCCTNEAARQRVARGLQQLRARLDRDFDGGRDAWRAVLVPFAAHAPVAGTAGLAGALVVSTKALCVALVCVVAGFFLWWWPAHSRAEFEDASLGGEGVVQDLDPQTTDSSGLESPRAAFARDAAEQLSRAHRLTGKIVDSSGAPLAGVDVTFSSAIGFGAPSVESDDAGRYNCQLDPEPAEGTPFEAFAELPGYCETKVPVRVGEEARIVMARLPRIEVSVVGPDGSAPEGSGNVKLIILDEQGSSRSTSLTLDEDGIARSDPLSPGKLVSVSSSFSGFAVQTERRDNDLVGDATLHVDVKLVRGLTLRGIVLDESTRRPLAGALVRAEPNYSISRAEAPCATTDSSGRFELRAVTATMRTFEEDRSLTESYFVTAEIDGYLLLSQRRLVLKHAAAAPKPALVDNIELLLMPTGRLIVKLHWPDGREAGTSDGNRDVQVFDSDFNMFGPGEVPAGDLHVIARALEPPGLAEADVSLRAGETRVIDLTLHAADASIEGRVVDAQGRGVPDVSLYGSNFIQRAGHRTYLDWFDPRTDAQGHFHIEGLYATSFQISVDGGELPMAYWPPRRTLELEAGSLTSGIDFKAAPAVTYSGSLAPMTAIDTSRPVSLRLTHAEFGNLELMRMEDDGSFEFSGMPGAEYVLIASQGNKELGRLALPQAGYRDLIVPIGP